MSKRSTFCIASSRRRVLRIIRDLEESGFPDSVISVLSLDRKVDADDVCTTEVSTPERTELTLAGSERSRTLASFPSLTRIVIAGSDPLVAAGPVAAVMNESTIGGVTSALVDFGVPQLEASRYEGRIKDGHTFISVHTENPDKSDRARAVFATAAAEDICTLIELPTPTRPSRHIQRPSPTFA